MGAKSKSKSTKKKGPKGKKARAKAKLEQVWGETFDEDERKASRVRTGGKSRLLESTTTGDNKNKQVKAVDALSNRGRRGVASPFDKFLERKEKFNDGGRVGGKGKGQRFQHDKKNDYASSDDSSGDESDDEMNGMTLLQRISGPQNSSRKMAVDSDDDADDSDEDSTESDNESESSEESGSDAEMKYSDEDEPAGESSSENKVVNNDQKAVVAEDPYEAHFSKPKLPELDTLQSDTQIAPHTGNNRKVLTASLLKSSMDVQMSGPLLDSWDKVMTNISGDNGKSPKKSKSNIHTKKAWEEYSAGPYQHVRQVLERNWKGVNKSALKRSSGGGEGKVFSPLQSVMYPAISRYADVLISSETRQKRDEINNLLSMHVVNHVLTSRTRVQRHNRRIKELTNGSDNDDGTNKLDDEGDDKWRDQGYTRPKVLILLPTRGTCYRFVQQMIQLLGESAIVDNGDRFDEEYGPLEQDGENDDSEEEGADAKARRTAVLKQKGAEWNELFGDDVNNDDDFKMGMSLTPNVVKSAGKKKSKHAGNAAGASGVNVKLFAEFYRSDIILASPIGLKMATTSDEDGDEDDAEADVDFLSSIDICLVARSDVLLMQNWDHVNSILDSLNQQPKKIADIDFSRVRNYFLEGQGAHWRQTIMVSQFTDPHILSTFRRHAKNIEGQLKIRQKVPADDASICDVMVRVKQVFQRVACQAVSEAGANRLRYFSEHVLPKLVRLKQKHTLIYVPSYFDFLAVRNLLLKRDADFVSVTEYARVSEVSRGRARFLQGRKSIMLYTGRAHFFLRHKIKGARHLIFFGLPEYSEFYPAVVNMLNEGLSSMEDFDGDGDISRMPMSCLSLFTKFDAHQLARVVGTSHTERMIKGEKSSYMFCS
mmetsp:Transcript_23035/g.49872  ORF Transcript_23035/g.49872 Transcript_23035/m.49872 type:complete len:880 (+) Transcript_23035:50-2689(+)|eukprot:CAMPEP_0172322370 /NCGR_PEP_ID=MMETSP1058-20130122/45712_1 /TAXON_ID=83371 /ORGANISM="Detonula confervacea, Strain CCMP 353" /LENGTH=879 /DNA_ID=CAMNT_0013038099 /DNA_START=11 /DNA_END=2650 /DNA_ORIENTATION=+